MKRYRKSAWLPWMLLLVGILFYVYYGVEWGAWMQNLPNIIIYACIIVALFFALRAKEKMNNN